MADRWIDLEARSWGLTLCLHRAYISAMLVTREYAEHWLSERSSRLVAGSCMSKLRAHYSGSEADMASGTDSKASAGALSTREIVALPEQESIR